MLISISRSPTSIMRLYLTYNLHFHHRSLAYNKIKLYTQINIIWLSYKWEGYVGKEYGNQNLISLRKCINLLTYFSICCKQPHVRFGSYLGHIKNFPTSRTVLSIIIIICSLFVCVCFVFNLFVFWTISGVFVFFVLLCVEFEATRIHRGRDQTGAVWKVWSCRISRF